MKNPRGKTVFSRKSFRGKWAVIGSLPAEVKSRINGDAAIPSITENQTKRVEGARRGERVRCGKSGTFEIEKED